MKGEIFINGKKRTYENKGSFDGEKWEQLKGFEKRRKNDLSAVFQLESAEIPEYKNGTANEDFGQRHEA